MEHFRVILGAMAANEHAEDHDQAKVKYKPFITIARQAGAGGHTIMDKLIVRLNEVDKAAQPWNGFDKEIVEYATQQDDVFRPLVETLETESRSFLDDIFNTLTSSRNVTEFGAYRRTAEVIEALAQFGRAVIVGRGGVFITGKRPGGTHIYLVAPRELRIEHMAELRGVSRSEAEAEVDRLDTNRHRFYARYWPNATVEPETFTATFNTAVSTDEDIVEAIVALTQGIRGTPIHVTPVGVGR